MVTLREGGTPLVEATNLSKILGNEIWLKYEGVNPTGSFKDRGMTMAISKAAEDGAKAVICASTGNTSAAAAAYGAAFAELETAHARAPLLTTIRTNPLPPDPQTGERVGQQLCETSAALRLLFCLVDA